MLQHEFEILGETGCVRFGYRRVVVNASGREEDAHEGADPVYGKISGFPVGFFQHAGLPVDLSVDIGILGQYLECLNACCDCDGVSRKSARLIDRAVRRDLPHDLLTSSVDRQRHASAYDLAVGDEVRRHSVVFCGSSRGETESRDHLVEYEQRAVLFADVLQALKITRFRRDDTHICGYRLHDYACDILPVFFEDPADLFQRVVFAHQGAVGICFGDARAVGFRVRQQPGSGLYQHPVGVSVVAAVEFQHEVAARIASCCPDGAHYGFRSAVDEAEHLDESGRLDDQLGQLALFLCRSAVCQPSLAGGFDRVYHLVPRRTQDVRTPGAHVIDIFVAVHVVDLISLGMVDEYGSRADVLEGPDRGVDPARHHLTGFLVQCFRFSMYHSVSLFVQPLSHV